MFFVENELTRNKYLIVIYITLKDSFNQLMFLYDYKKTFLKCSKIVNPPILIIEYLLSLIMVADIINRKNII